MADRKKKTRSQLEAENEYLRKGSLIKSITTVSTSFFRWGGLVVIFYFGYQSIVSLSGKNTTADINVIGQITSNLIEETPIPHIIAYAVGTLGVLYGALQRNLKKRVIEKFESQKTLWEKGVDKGRKSSLLTKNGTTRPEDK